MVAEELSEKPEEQAQEAGGGAALSCGRVRERPVSHPPPLQGGRRQAGRPRLTRAAHAWQERAVTEGSPQGRGKSPRREGEKAELLRSGFSLLASGRRLHRTVALGKNWGCHKSGEGKRWLGHISWMGGSPQEVLEELATVSTELLSAAFGIQGRTGAVPGDQRPANAPFLDQVIVARLRALRKQGGISRSQHGLGRNRSVQTNFNSFFARVASLGDGGTPWKWPI